MIDPYYLLFLTACALWMIIWTFFTLEKNSYFLQIKYDPKIVLLGLLGIHSYLCCIFWIVFGKENVEKLRFVERYSFHKNYRNIREGLDIELSYLTNEPPDNNLKEKDVNENENFGLDLIFENFSFLKIESTKVEDWTKYHLVLALHYIHMANLMELNREKNEINCAF